MKYYTIREEFLTAWTNDTSVTAETVIDSDDVSRLAREWGMDEDELISEQLIEVNPSDDARNPDPIETLISDGTRIPARHEHGNGDGDYRIVSSSGKIVSHHRTENAAVKAFRNYVAAYPDEFDGASLQVWARNRNVSGHPYRWTVIM